MTLDWKDYFTAPFHTDGYGYILDSAGHPVLMDGYDILSDSAYNALAHAMNGEPIIGHPYIFGNPKYVGSLSDSYVEFENGDETYKLDIRGWGYLTGRCGLDSGDAAKVQDAFGAFVVKCMEAANDA